MNATEAAADRWDQEARRNRHRWRADEDGVSLHVPDPSGLTDGATVRIPDWEVARMFTAVRSAQLGTNGRGDL